jgi:hypothetical protein
VKIVDLLRSLFRRQEPPTSELPGTADLIASIFVRDCQRQEAQHLSCTRFAMNDELNIGTKNGVAFISSPPRRIAHNRR